MRDSTRNIAWLVFSGGVLVLVLGGVALRRYRGEHVERISLIALMFAMASLIASILASTEVIGEFEGFMLQIVAGILGLLPLVIDSHFADVPIFAVERFLKWDDAGVTDASEKYFAFGGLYFIGIRLAVCTMIGLLCYFLWFLYFKIYVGLRP